MREMLEHSAYKFLRDLSNRPNCRVNDLVVNYRILKNDGKYQGIESHKQAIREDMKITAQNLPKEVEYLKPQYIIDESKLFGVEVPINDFFTTSYILVNKNNCKNDLNDKYMYERLKEKTLIDINTIPYNHFLIDTNNDTIQPMSDSVAESLFEKLSKKTLACFDMTNFYTIDYIKNRSYYIVPIDNGKYFYTFIDPPYSNKYNVKDFKTLNDILFPNKSQLEIYDWLSNLTGDETTDDNLIWADCFSIGLLWWGSFCWTVYDKLQDIFVVISASASD